MHGQLQLTRTSNGISRSIAVALILSLMLAMFGPGSFLPADAAGTPGDRNALERVVRVNPANNVPFVAGQRVNDYVTGVVEIGDTVVVVGKFPSVRNPGSQTSIPRTNIFAYSKSTGQVSTSFVPQVNGVIDAVVAAPDGQSVIIAGNFSQVNNQASFGLAKLRLSNGERLPFPTTQGRVRDMVIRGNDLYIGGDFWNVGGVNRERLAKLNATTGAVDPSFNVAVGPPRLGTHNWVASLDISADNTKMVIAGNFVEVGGQPRVQVALIDIPGNQVLPWSTTGYTSACSSSFWTYMRDIEFAPDGSFFVAATTGGPFTGTLCDTAARWETDPNRTNASATWVNWSGGDTLTAVAVTKTTVYIGGHQRWMNNHLGRDSAGAGAVSREGLAALDPSNGIPYRWNPGRDRGSIVHTLHVVPTGLYLGGDTDTVNFQNKGKLAFFPVTGGTDVPQPTPAELPVTVYQAQSNGSLTRRSYDTNNVTTPTPVSGTGITWSTLRGVTLEAGYLYYTLSDNRLYRRSYNGTTFGPQEDLVTGVYAGTAPSLQGVTAMTWHNGRLYYTRSGQSALFYRYLSLESGIIGSETFSIPSQPTGFQASGTTGMEVIGDYLYYTRTDGILRRIRMENGVPVPGTVQVLSGPNIDGQSWAGLDFFVESEQPTDQPPSVQITSPSNGAVVSGSVNITANASDDDGVTRVVFEVDGNVVGTDTNGANGWSVSWDTTDVGNGPHTITATATDTGDQSTESAPVSVTVDNFVDQPPSVTITSPEEDEEVSGTVTIAADASDDVEVTQVAFRVGTTALGIDDDGSDGWSTTWDTTTVPNGDYTITATATDSSGQTDSDQVTVAVANVGAVETVFSGMVDSAGAMAPRWVSTVWTPSVSGQYVLTLDWSNAAANLRFDIRLASNNAWVGANTTTAMPKTIQANLTAGTAYQVAVWSMDGSTPFSVTALPPGGGGGTPPTDQPPSVSITAPANGSEVSGTVNITANATDDNSVTQVVFEVDDNPIGTDTNGSNGWSVSWDTTTVSNGPHTIIATATDNNNQTTTSGPVSVTVNNAAETEEGRPVVLVSIDGLNSAALEAADTPAWDKIVAEGASTLNARSVVESTQTLPNHASILTGRGVATASGGHGVTFNEDNSSTIHASAGSYVASIFDVVHDAGMSTSFYTQKSKMNFFDRSWNGTNGAPDTTGDDNGRDKIDVFRQTNPTTIIAEVKARWADDPDELTFIHFGDTDFAGHDFGWGSNQYIDAIETVDGYLGQLLAAIESEPNMEDAVLIVTSDHGGTGSFHNVATDPANYTIPFAVWGDGVTAGVDLYDINPTRTGPGTSQPPYAAPGQPIRNADAANLVTKLLGLPAVPGSTINTQANLAISGTPPADEPPSVELTAPADGSTVTGTVAVTADATDDEGIASVRFEVDGTAIATDNDGSNGWSVDWDTTTVDDGTHTLAAVATDTNGQTDRDEITVTVENSSDPVAQVLFVVGDPAALSPDDEAIVDRLESTGHTVEVADDNGVTADDAEGVGFVLVSASVSSGATNTAFRNISVPVWVAKPFFFDDMGLTGPAADVDYGSKTVSAIDIVDPGHPLAAGRSGAVVLRSGTYRVSFGRVPASATVIATAAGDPTVFAFDAGDALFDGTPAPGCRISFPLFTNAVRWYNNDAWAMFDAATDYALSGCE